MDPYPYAGSLPHSYSNAYCNSDTYSLPHAHGYAYSGAHRSARKSPRPAVQCRQ